MTLPKEPRWTRYWVWCSMSNMPHKENRYRRGEQVLQEPFRSEIFRSSQAVENCGFGQIMEKASTRPRAVKLKRTRGINSPTLRPYWRIFLEPRNFIVYCNGNSPKSLLWIIHILSWCSCGVLDIALLSLGLLWHGLLIIELLIVLLIILWRIKKRFVFPGVIKQINNN